LTVEELSIGAALGTSTTTTGCVETEDVGRAPCSMPDERAFVVHLIRVRLLLPFVLDLRSKSLLGCSSCFTKLSCSASRLILRLDRKVKCREGWAGISNCVPLCFCCTSSALPGPLWGADENRTSIVNYF